MFAFITITYNHEKYIIEHLESIKYQIETHSLADVFLIICDDCSTDHTVELISRWTIRNESLFLNVKIMKSEVNKGIVSNYIRAVNEIPCEKFKILAGDDLYYKHNISNALDGNDFLSSPVIKFSEEGFVLPLWFEQKSIDSLDKLKKKMKKGNPLVAPGIFTSKQLIHDKQLLDFIGKYKWIEDYPTWHYIFIKNNKKVKYAVSYKPYILYRFSVGISGSKTYTSNFKTMFLLEENKMLKELGVKRSSHTNKFLSISNYYNRLVRLFDDCLRLSKNCLRLSKNLSKEHDFLHQDVSHYYNTIKENAVRFLIDLGVTQ